VITLTSSSATATVSTTANDMQWTPGTGTTDLAGNALTNAGQTVTEQRSGASADKEF
jgi:hypothetical protein